MLRISCPVCGLRDEVEFQYGGDASVRRPDLDDASIDNWCDFLFKRRNNPGPHLEYWHHVSGCRQWIVVERDTRSHSISSVVLAKEEAGKKHHGNGGLP